MSKKPIFERVVDPSPPVGKRETVEETAERLIDGKKRSSGLVTEKLTTYVFAEQKKRVLSVRLRRRPAGGAAGWHRRTSNTVRRERRASVALLRRATGPQVTPTRARAAAAGAVRRPSGATARAA